MFINKLYLLLRNFISVLALAGILMMTPAMAQDVLPGHDIWETGVGAAHDFSSDPIPADFFDPGSDPFIGLIPLVGVPLGTFLGQNTSSADTVVKRLSPAVLPAVGPGGDTIPIELVALSLKSVSPIEVTDGGGSEFWDVFVELSTLAPSSGTMSINKISPSGGEYDSALNVQPKFTFTRITTPFDVRVLDDLSAVPSLFMVTVFPTLWEYGPTNNQLVVPTVNGPNFWPYPNSFRTGGLQPVLLTVQAQAVPELATLIPFLTVILLGGIIYGKQRWKRYVHTFTT